ncbi:hypothetical protein [Pseudoroseicyclus tamaricis]|uniref:Acetyltransferase (GNAT) family protein n=1 Tax=Pseudoroseicyclus tamaricis TaxID=2705421 RepID=A0A6B2K0H5_9RHOB|nr:hypothetical protein [Pseudoroseicyclus tamaricis]NDU99815.1 hypothetical protein [Pseudoroseicyclus tamaricis]
MASGCDIPVWTCALTSGTIRLDTGPLHHEARALYHAAGFTGRGPYVEMPPELAAGLVFMERRV